MLTLKDFPECVKIIKSLSICIKSRLACLPLSITAS